MTPAYASPEQVRGGPVTPLSDVYSLGVVLYQLLVGVLPCRGHGPASSADSHALGAGPILKPSKSVKDGNLASQLSGDLDSIVIRALEYEPERRYQQAGQLSDDLHRYFAKEPVHARPQTGHYLALRFAQRNRGKVAALLAVLFAFVIGLSVSVHETRVAVARLRNIQTPANQASRATVRDTSVDVYRSLTRQQEGDALAAAGKFAAAEQAYLDSANNAEACMKLAQDACLLLDIESNRRLAQNSVALGRRGEAMEFAQRALHAGEDLPGGTAPSFALPRAFAAMGLTYAALGSSPLHSSDDYQQAQLWLRRSLIAWRAAQREWGLSADDQQVMRKVEESLSHIDP